jgi:ribosomal protein L13E
MAISGSSNKHKAGRKMSRSSRTKRSQQSRGFARQQGSVRPKPTKQNAPSSLPLGLENKKGQVQATKHDYGKIQFLFPVRALSETNRVFTFGGRKYKIGNWHSGNGFDFQRLYDAGLGHVLNSMLGEDLDEETGMWHLAHAMCCFSMLLEHQLVGIGSDTRNQANARLDKKYNARDIAIKGKALEYFLKQAKKVTHARR